MSEYDAVLSYHMNPAACGVCKFNYALANRLGVAHDRLTNSYRYHHPLVSVKASELGEWWRSMIPASCDLLLHDRPASVPSKGRRVFYADVIGCPSTVEGDATRGAYRVLVFGMSNKLLLPHFEQLKRDLDRDHADYTIELSTAVHEGNPWDQALAESTAAMRGVFGDKLRVLGFLADDALARTLTEVDAVAAFYSPALRANNTTAWAAIAAGKTLFTNRDAHSPTQAPTWESVIAQLATPTAVSKIPAMVSPRIESEFPDDYTEPPAA